MLGWQHRPNQIVCFAVSFRSLWAKRGLIARHVSHFTRSNIMRIFSSLLFIVFAAMSANAAQLYRWVDAKGNVEWRDTPPPASVPAKKVEQRRVGDNVTPGDDLPFSVQLAAKNHPVTLWATDCGTVCTNARAHLSRRGIPYTDKNPQSDYDAFKKISPDGNMPVLQVGSTRLTGYLESEWDSTLDYAGYPRTALITTRPKPPATVPKPVTDGAKPAEGTPTTPKPPAPAIPGTAAAPPVTPAK
jgi:hypothetical protein